MLFLLSALCAEVRPRIRDEYHGLIYLMEAIDLILKNNAENFAVKFPNRNKRRSKGSRRGKKGTTGEKESVDDYLVAYYLDDWEVDLANEVLKVLFNLTVNVDRNNLDEVNIDLIFEFSFFKVFFPLLLSMLFSLKFLIEFKTNFLFIYSITRKLNYSLFAIKCNCNQIYFELI